MPFKITFNGVDNPSVMKIQSVDFSILPQVTSDIRKFAGINGAVDAGITFQEKLITVSYTLVPTALNSLLYEARNTVYSFIRGNNFKLSELVISDEPDKFYSARINSSSEIKDQLFYGEGTLEFIVPSGYSYTKTGATYTGNNTAKTLTVINAGTVDYYPLLSYTFTSNLTGTLRFTNNTTGDSLSVTGTFVIGDILLIDFQNMTVKKNGTITMSILDYTSKFFSLPNNSTTVIAYTLEGTLTTTVYPRYY